jgi:hypothetical protein
METIRINTIIKDDGHLKIDIPTPLEGGEFEVILVIQKKNKPVSGYDFSDIAGKLQWEGNAVDTQRALKNEWE